MSEYDARVTALFPEGPRFESGTKVWLAETAPEHLKEAYGAGPFLVHGFHIKGFQKGGPEYQFIDLPNRNSGQLDSVQSCYLTKNRP